MEFTYDRYIKLITIQVTDFSSEIIDEKNFGIYDEYEIMQFRKKYNRYDDCVVVTVEM